MPLTAAKRVDRATDRSEPLLVTVEQPARPVGRWECFRHDVRDRDGIVRDERLLLSRERGHELVVRRPVDHDRQPPLGDPRMDLDRELERHRANLLEPEPELLDEVEREAVGPRWARCDHDRIELDRVARLDEARERSPDAVPDYGVAELVEPVVGELEPLLPPRLPRRGPGVLEPHGQPSTPSLTTVP